MPENSEIMGTFKHFLKNNMAGHSFEHSYCEWILILHSLQVDTAWNAGDRQGARRNSYVALALNIASIIGGIALTVTLILYYHSHNGYP